MDCPHSETDSIPSEPTPRWQPALLTSLRYLSWALFVYSTPGLLLVVLVVAAWLAPGIAVLLVLMAVQVPVYFALRALVRSKQASSPDPVDDPRFSVDYWSGRKSADFGSSRST